MVQHLSLNCYLAPFSATGKMPVPQKISFLVEQVRCLFIKALLKMVQHLSLNELQRTQLPTANCLLTAEDLIKIPSPQLPHPNSEQLPV